MEERNILGAMKRRKAICIGHVVHRNCLLKQFIKEKIEGYIYKRREVEEEDVSNYYMNSRKEDGIRNRNRKH